MTIFQTPSTLPNAIKELPTSEEQERLLAECREVDKANEQAWQELQARFQALKKDVAEFIHYQDRIFRPTDPIRIWMHKGPLEYSLFRFMRTCATTMQDAFSNIKQREEAEKRRKIEEEQKRRNDLKPARAVIFLVKHGKVEGQDFTAESAVHHANALAREKLINAKLAEGGPFSFSGEDTCEDCDGWDGTSRRCNCGNRRVGWEMEGDFEAFDAGHAYVYGEAF